MRKLRWFLPLMVSIVVAACGSTQPSSLATSGPATSASPTTGESPAVSASESPVASGAPESEPPAESPQPTESQPPAQSVPPTESAAPSPTEEPTQAPGAADACTGTDANREFFASVAASVNWPVLCAVLPSHWFVDKGEYHLAKGGYLVITYKGPGGSTLALSEGAFCSDANGCVPSGADTGDASLGSLGGTLVTLDDGDLAIVVDRGANPSWLVVTHGVDAATTTSLGAAMVEVGG